MKHLRISDDLQLPLDVVTQKLAFIGRTGSGKTYAATKLAELMLDAGAQIVVLDQVGVWHGLRMGEDPYPIRVFGGLRGDIPLPTTGGAVMADLIVDRGFPAVLDVSQMISAEQCRFATDFADRFFQRKKASPSAVHVFLEECQEVVPQNHQRGEERMVHVFQRMQKLGRGFGIGVSLISQRPQEINKKALNQTECLFAFQMTGPQERKAIADWVHDKGLDIDVQAILPKLAVGEAHVWSPQWLDVSKTVRIAKKHTADVSATPKVGAKVAVVRDLSPIDLEDLRQQLSATIERAKGEDPKALRAEITRLQRELAAKPAPTAAKFERVEIPVLKDAQLVRTEKLAERMETAAGAMNEQARELRRLIALAGPLSRLPLPNTNGVHRAPASRDPAASDQSRNVATIRHSSVTTGDAGIGNSGMRRMLIALAQNSAGVTGTKLSILTSIARRGGTWRTYMSKLRGFGYAEGGDDCIRITESGLSALGAFEPLPTGAALVDHWRAELGDSGMRRLFDALVAAWPAGLAKEDLSAATGIAMEGGTWRTYLSKLRSLELVVGKDELKAAADLFEEGAR